MRWLLVILPGIFICSCRTNKDSTYRSGKEIDTTGMEVAVSSSISLESLVTCESFNADSITFTRVSATDGVSDSSRIVVFNPRFDRTKNKNTVDRNESRDSVGVEEKVSESVHEDVQSSTVAVAEPPDLMKYLYLGLVSVAVIAGLAFIIRYMLKNK